MIYCLEVAIILSSALLLDMTPLEYLREYVANTKMNMLLYEYIYKKYTSVNDHLTSEVTLEIFQSQDISLELLLA